jgi:hypothetical protein
LRRRFGGQVRQRPAVRAHLMDVQVPSAGRSTRNTSMPVCLRVSCVLGVCGAFGWRALSEDFAAGVGDGIVLSSPNFRSKAWRRPARRDSGQGSISATTRGGLRRPGSLFARPFPCGSRGCVEDHDVAWLEDRDKELLDVETSPDLAEEATHHRGVGHDPRSAERRSQSAGGLSGILCAGP